MELWRRCFEDTDEFIRFYFERKYSDANSLIYEKNGKALSALQMLPYPMRWEKCHGRYILYLGSMYPTRCPQPGLYDPAPPKCFAGDVRPRDCLQHPDSG